MIDLLYIDLFCGAGGTSTGISSARLDDSECAKVIACVNHDAKAIASHAANHPDALHFTEDIRTLDLTPLLAHLNTCRKKYPEAKICLWASLECTNFSKAKGGLPRNADSRTLAEHLFRYIETLNPDYIQIENVEEFMSWGDLDENGKPVSLTKGSSYLRWVNKVKSYGFDFDWRIINSANYGAYTSRKRYFAIFSKHELPVAWPVPTHSKDGTDDLFGGLKRWKPVREVLDLDDEGESIFNRKKPLAENTLARIYAGLIKFVAGGKDAFLVKYNSMSKKGKYYAPSIEEPSPVVATQGRLGIARVSFLSKQFSGDPYSKNHSIDNPAGTVTTVDHHAFISVFYGNGYNSDCDSVCPAITTKDKCALISTSFLANEYSGGGQVSSIDNPNPAVLTNPKQKLISVNQINHWLLNPQFTSAGSSVDSPCFTLIARMDKRPPYLVSYSEGVFCIPVYEDDSPNMVKIKHFMAMYGIYDIKMRMLKIEELTLIMGFPEDYVLIGTQADRKKFIGNAVEVNTSRQLCEALCASLRSYKEELALLQGEDIDYYKQHSA